MTDLALKILEKFGLPTLVAVGLGWLLATQSAQASKERVEHMTILLDQVADLKESAAKLEGMCSRPSTQDPR